MRRGINFPAAGKTGTSHDGWFAGFTSKLICVVWVGFDDNRELNLEGAKSALPVWAEFMKRAHEHREYRNVTDFTAPAGIVSAQIDPTSGQLATAACPTVRTEYFIEGTQPGRDLLSARRRRGTHGWLGAASGTRAGYAGHHGAPAPPLTANVPPAKPNTPEVVGEPKKKGVFGKIRDIFRKPQ